MRRATEKPNVAGLGESLYTDHLVTVGLAGVLLFVALVGAVAITNPKRIEPTRSRDPSRQVPIADSQARLSIAERRRPWTPTDVFTLDVLRDYLLVGAVLFALGMLGFLSPQEPDRDVPVGRDDAARDGA